MSVHLHHHWSGRGFNRNTAPRSSRGGSRLLQEGVSHDGDCTEAKDQYWIVQIKENVFFSFGTLFLFTKKEKHEGWNALARNRIFQLQSSFNLVRFEVSYFIFINEKEHFSIQFFYSVDI